MEKEWMRRQLPEKPPEGLVGWVRKNYPEELGPEYLVFKGERVPIAPSLAEIMEYNSLNPRRYEWVADCHCTACGDDFYTQKVTGHDAVRIAVGEDGMPYTLDPGEPYAEEALLNHIAVEEAFSGERMVCPLCFSEVEVIHSRKLRGGRTKRIMVQTVQNVQGYTTIFYWMVFRYIGEYGESYVDAEPMDAYVLTERGGLVRYTHVQRSSFGIYRNLHGWVRMERCEDKHDSLYSDWGSINNKKSGAVLFPECPELGGTTGEKTGLPEYMAAGGYGLVQYLKFWRQHRNVENLVKAGQAELVAGIFRKANSYCYSIRSEMEKYVDLKEKKPHRMLRLSKEEFRHIRKQRNGLTVDTLDLFNSYRKIGGRLDLIAFLDLYPDFGTRGVNAAMRIMRESPGADLDKIARYMAKQKMRMGEVQYLVDVRQMARSLFAPRPLTEEELWPRNLDAYHERLTQIQAERRRMEDAKKREKFNQKFAEVIDRYGCLQWTDGELCILLPKTSMELYDEGETLRHCVGGYSDRHIKGSDTIFFVRHYRRPERSYYTLDIRMNNGIPKEVQLHGYGNERHGKNKEYSHKIPKKVRDFVDRWKREVLMPWWVEQNKALQKEKSA